jgi:hypothetical protein
MNVLSNGYGTIFFEKIIDLKFSVVPRHKYELIGLDRNVNIKKAWDNILKKYY